MRPVAFLIQGDARHLPLPDQSVQCVVTSPPYWGLRDYGLPPLVWDDPGGCEHEWGQFQNANEGVKTRWTHNPTSLRDQTLGGIAAMTCLYCSAWRGSLGLEPTPDLYVQHLVEIFREVRRVLRDDGTVWLNLGDSYSGSWSGNSMRPEGGHQRPGHPGFQPLDERVPARGGNVPPGLKTKDLVGLPWRVAFALQADGWWLRSDIIWSKPNPMPESVTDRPTKSHEYLFLLTKSELYYYDAEAIKEPAIWMRESGRNRRTVWEIATAPFHEAHFATFPPDLVKPCILAGSPEGGIVLDPFVGSGTAVLVAKELGRVGVGVDLKPEYLQMAAKRTAQGQLV